MLSRAQVHPLEGEAVPLRDVWEGLLSGAHSNGASRVAQPASAERRRRAAHTRAHTGAGGQQSGDRSAAALRRAAAVALNTSIAIRSDQIRMRRSEVNSRRA